MHWIFRHRNPRADDPASDDCPFTPAGTPLAEWRCATGNRAAGGACVWIQLVLRAKQRALTAEHYDAGGTLRAPPALSLGIRCLRLLGLTATARLASAASDAGGRPPRAFGTINQAVPTQAHAAAACVWRVCSPPEITGNPTRCRASVDVRGGPSRALMRILSTGSDSAWRSSTTGVSPTRAVVIHPAPPFERGSATSPSAATRREPHREDQAERAPWYYRAEPERPIPVGFGGHVSVTVRLSIAILDAGRLRADSPTAVVPRVRPRPDGTHRVVADAECPPRRPGEPRSPRTVRPHRHGRSRACAQPGHSYLPDERSEKFHCLADVSLGRIARNVGRFSLCATHHPANFDAMLSLTHGRRGADNGLSQSPPTTASRCAPPSAKGRPCDLREAIWPAAVQLCSRVRLPRNGV